MIDYKTQFGTLYYYINFDWNLRYKAKLNIANQICSVHSSTIKFTILIINHDVSDWSKNIELTNVDVPTHHYSCTFRACTDHYWMGMSRNGIGMDKQRNCLLRRDKKQRVQELVVDRICIWLLVMMLVMTILEQEQRMGMEWMMEIMYWLYLVQSTVSNPSWDI